MAFFSPQLTWRDLQHIVVQTAQRANLKADDWVQNGAGRNGMYDQNSSVSDYVTTPDRYNNLCLCYVGLFSICNLLACLSGVSHILCFRDVFNMNCLCGCATLVGQCCVRYYLYGAVEFLV